jgi:hypothetical protein
MVKKCKKCGKLATELYYTTHFTGQFTISVDSMGNEDVDWGGYNLADDFIDNMLIETGRRKLIGCNNCIK